MRNVAAILKNIRAFLRKFREQTNGYTNAANSQACCIKELLKNWHVRGGKYIYILKIAQNNN